MSPSQKSTTERRRFLRAAALATGGAILAARSSAGDPLSGERTANPPDGDPSPRYPTVFLPHGGGPWPFLKENVFGAPDMWDRMGDYLRRLNMVPPKPPRAVLLVSAHWEEQVPTLMTAKRPPMLYDYYGFPREAYEVRWPAPGAPELAAEVRELLEQAGIRSGVDPARGFDHGTFVPLALAYPDAGMPTTQLSLKRGLDPETHIRIGQALAPLRDKGVFIVGSGMSYHNLPALMGRDRGEVTEGSRVFDEWLLETIALEPSARAARLIEWEGAPAARRAHPREEHLLPLMVVLGAALEDDATAPYRDVVMDAHVSAVHLGS